MNDAPHKSTASPGKFAAIVLALLVHLALAVFLIYGIHWQTRTSAVVQVDLVRPAENPVPNPAPNPAGNPPEKPKEKPEQNPQPKPEIKPAPPAKPVIAIKEKPKPDPKPAPSPKPDLNFFDRQMAAEEKRITAQRQNAAEEERIRQQNDAATAAARNKALASYTDRIRARIKNAINMPINLQGNPVAVFDVVQLPSGEVMSVKLVKPSGAPAWDSAVERAIYKASPLPKPDNPDLFARDLHLTFCPQEDGKCS
jgi:colicin import membrane protein